MQVLFTVGHVFPRIGSRPEYCTSHIPGSSSLLITSIRRRSLIEARVSQPVYASISIQRLSLVFLPNGIGSRTLTNPLLSKNPQRRRQQGSPTSGAGERSDTDASDRAARPHNRARATSLLVSGGRERRAFDSSLRVGGRRGGGAGRAGAGKALLTGECHTIAIMLPGYPPHGILALTGRRNALPPCSGMPAFHRHRRGNLRPDPRPWSGRRRLTGTQHQAASAARAHPGGGDGESHGALT